MIEQNFTLMKLSKTTEFLIITDTLDAVSLPIYNERFTGDTAEKDIKYHVERLRDNRKLLEELVFDVCLINDQYYVIDHVFELQVASEFNALPKLKKEDYSVRFYSDIKTITQASLFKSELIKDITEDSKLYTRYINSIPDDLDFYDEDVANELKITITQATRLQTIRRFGTEEEIDKLLQNQASIIETYVNINYRVRDEILLASRNQKVDDYIKKWIDMDKYNSVTDEDIVNIFQQEQDEAFHQKVRELDDRELSIKETEDNYKLLKRMVFTLGAEYVWNKVKRYIKSENLKKEISDDIASKFKNNPKANKTIDFLKVKNGK